MVVDGLNLDEVKTKTMQGFLNTVGAKKAVIVTPEVNETVIKSARNIPGVVTTTAKILSVYDIVNAGKFIVDKAVSGRHRGGVCVMATTAFDIIKRPVITEQSMRRPRPRSNTFEVAKDANKIEIAKAVGGDLRREGGQGEHPGTCRQGEAHRPFPRRPPGQLEEGYGHPDRGLQDHRVLRRHGVRRIRNNGYQNL